jgi:hypothetical protein
LLLVAVEPLFVCRTFEYDASKDEVGLIFAVQVVGDNLRDYFL